MSSFASDEFTYGLLLLTKADSASKILTGAPVLMFKFSAPKSKVALCSLA